MADALPPCGLYRTATAHPERTEQVAAGKLVYFHNHSNQGDAPLVLLPKDNAANKWSFSDRGYLVQTKSWCRTLVPLKPEGIYTVGQAFQNGTTVVAQGQIVQLGYNREGEPIVFFPRYEVGQNALVFATKGMRVAAPIYDTLQGVELRGPVAATPRVN